MGTWSSGLSKECRLIAAGTGAFGTTLDNAAAADASVNGGSTLVRMPSTGHGYKAGSVVEIAGTTNYDGTYTIAAAATNTFDIYGTYVAETFAGTETVRVVLSSGFPFDLLEVKIHINTAPTTAENFTITRDANEGAYWDELVRSYGMAGVTDFLWDVRDTPLRYQANDKLIFAYTNTDGRTWALEALYGRKGG